MKDLAVDHRNPFLLNPKIYARWLLRPLDSFGIIFRQFGIDYDHQRDVAQATRALCLSVASQVWLWRVEFGSCPPKLAVLVVPGPPEFADRCAVEFMNTDPCCLDDEFRCKAQALVLDPAAWKEHKGFVSALRAWSLKGAYV